MDIKITMTDNNSNRMVKHSGQVFTPDVNGTLNLKIGFTL